MPHLTPVTTARLGEHLPLLELLPDADPVTWVRRGEGLVGWGVHASTTVSGPQRFRQAREWWHQELEKLAVTDSVHLSGTGPILFASFSFSPADESVLTMPKVVVGTRAGQSWITWIGDGPQPELLDAADSVVPGNYSWRNGTISVDEWQGQVAKAIDSIQSKTIDKVVLARDLNGATTNRIDPRSILRNLALEYPATWCFSIAGLVGATPELLLRLNRAMVTSRVLAGTISRTGDDEKDLALAASLARSSKDLEEHMYAVRSVAESLAPFCTSTNVPDSPFVLHLANVMHLATDVTGAISEFPQHVDTFSILEKLHPSAAVCGTPTEMATKVIADLEGMPRGRYAGPVGWIDARGDGELGIALRCGQISENEIRLFAGCGIVAGSDPRRELAESQAKFAPMMSALGSN
ncbi:MAG: isochorismate synthase [Candidatus Nanopelagicaceae bacterium]|nr:isochorismate synthase [Candidatus Nanopelagicaceae bacterium]